MNTNPLLNRNFPASLDERKGGDRRKVLDTRTHVDIDVTSQWLGDADRRHRERRQYADRPAAPSLFASLA